ncbi:MAG: Eco57I restriction-modification methylase domain-containing protein [Bacteroidales bacterium]|nr:Eco57I restriction-modification methylase domain-containing protein [Bacteroidales bacterium]
MATFGSALTSRLIYVFAINDKEHKGCLKIGETSIDNCNSLFLEPNCEILNKAARERIDQYTQTAGISYQLLYTEMTLFVKDRNITSFNDKEVHSILDRSGIKKKEFSTNKKATEWYITDLETVKKAIQAAKDGRKSLNASEISNDYTPIIFRPEQREAIDRTKKQLKKGKRMLWNAKMRFGKTLSALQVVKEMGFAKTIILTHRPVVNEGWFDDFGKIFYDSPNYCYSSKTQGESFDSLKKQNARKFVYFASMQDLRGSELVGGKFDKNSDVFSVEWDLVIVDEAHEGTQTQLGKNVVEELDKSNTKLLQLSGTPFNLLDEYKDNEIYTWDYIMEQRAKREWDIINFGSNNPYASLPAINIYTYDLGKLLTSNFVEDEMAFNFREFFRTKSDGTFIHDKDIDNFLNLLCKSDKDSLYPYSNDEYRKIFRHTLWVVPGVKAAKALSSKLQKHDVFGMFKVVNVAGNGDDDEENNEALDLVEKAIGDNPDDTYTITLSCGRLTTGVSVKPWTGVFMMAGSYSTSAAQYMQTIFRVQTPFTCNGKMKEQCYAFDFAPDRTLRVLTEAAKVSAKAGKTTDEDRQILGDFLNFFPIISIDGSQMKKYDVNNMMGQLKKVQVERAVNCGFDDNSIYNDELLKLDEVSLGEFEDLKKIIKTTPANAKTGNIDVNNQGFTNEEYEEKEKLEKKKKKDLTEEEKKRLEELKNKRTQREQAISILRGISIRMPLLIYGAELKDENKELTIDNFAKIVDDKSWEEFMPKGVTKAVFAKFKRYYDPDIFREAGKRIREIARVADNFTIEERIERIANIFSTFRNPDKETVLTPWRVVNMHMGDCLGGYCFYNEGYDKNIATPRYIDHGKVTADVFNPDSHILEINSKTGLYPLYVAYSVYRSRVEAAREKFGEISLGVAQKLWDATIEQNILVVCNTPMAKSITKRTLAGFRDVRVNAQHYPDLIKNVKEEPTAVVNTLKNGKTYWKINNEENMKINAVVGNPPYQLVVAKKDTENGQKAVVNIFHYFQILADKLNPSYTSLIYPGGRWIHRSGKGLSDFGLKQINDRKLKLVEFFPDSNYIFKDAGIADGISIVMKDFSKKEAGFTYKYGDDIQGEMENPGEKLISLNPRNNIIIKNIEATVDVLRINYLSEFILPRSLFSIESDFVEKNPSLVREYSNGDFFDTDKEIKLYTNDKAGKSGRGKWYVIDKDIIKTGKEYINDWKVVVSSANAGGQKRSNQLAILDNYSVFGRSRVALRIFKTEKEAQNFYNYVKTELIRFAFLMTDESLTSLAKKVPDIINYSDNNKLINFEEELDGQLYELFNIDTESQQYIKNILQAKQNN